MRTVLIIGVLAAASATAACGSDGGDVEASGPADRPSVIVTTSVLGDVVRSAVGEGADVEVLMPPGADPHSFEASARQAAAVRDADLVIANGLGLESALDSLLDEAADDGVAILEVAPALDPLPFADGEAHTETDGDAHTETDGEAHAATDGAHAGDGDHADEGEPAAEGDDHDHGDLDPHVWLDPVRMAEAVTIVADAVAELPGADARAVDAQAAAYRQVIEDLHAEIGEVLAPVPPDRRRLVTNHDNLGYFAARYDVDIVGVVIPGGTTLSEASAGELAELAHDIEEAGVEVVVAENVASDRLVAALAREVGGVEVVTLFTDALGGPDSGAATYVEMMRTNAQRLSSALAA